MRNSKFHSFSIIVAAHNEDKYIADCIRALKLQDYQGEFEIIVVDNASNDKTQEVSRELGVRVIYEPKKGVSHALISGVRSAMGEILAFTDADTRPPKEWLSRLNNVFNLTENVAAGGPPYYYDGPNWANFFMKNFFSPIYLKFFHERNHGLPGCNLAVRSDIYYKTGGFTPGFNWGQDWKMGGKASKFGKVIFHPEIYVYTSFRRFYGNHTHPVLKTARAIKEIFIASMRMIPMVYFNTNLKPQKPIR